MNLHKCTINTFYRIISINAPISIKNIIYSLGILPDMYIKKIYKSIFSRQNICEINNRMVIISDEYLKYIEVNNLE